ncbi:MAG: DUF1593 domain-containing protein [Planctomycetaceae bacterium]|nr:DUF1593 domain-containing protein [Planctomycetaceae bacterium]
MPIVFLLVILNAVLIQTHQIFFLATEFEIANRHLPTERLRVIIETDAGGDPDDEQSLVRFLLYSNEWDVEGIICNRARARDGENLNTARTGLEIVRRMVAAYGECHSNLIQHDSQYPAAERLLQRTVPGYSDTDDGVKLIIAAVDSPDPRPIWFMNWGTDHGAAPSCLKRALDQVLAERGPEGYSKFKSRLRISGDDRFDQHTTEFLPPFPIWVNTKGPELERQRWYRRFGPLSANAGGFDLARDALTDHGPLGALYPTNTDIPQKEGDTPQFLYLVPTGMNDPNQPNWGSWAGRYGRNENFSDRRVYWANQADDWHGTIHRENSLRRWSEDFQNDFRARLDWCVQKSSNANHPPIPVLNGVPGREIVSISASAGAMIKLVTTGTIDPDGDALEYSWSHYREAGTYLSEVSIPTPDASGLELEIPQNASGTAIHIILTVRDNGEPNLTRYRRVIVNVNKE